MNFSFTNYNLSPAAVTVSGTTLTINQSGLYHFEIFLYAEVGTASPISYIPDLNFNFRLGTKIYQLCSKRLLLHQYPLPTTIFAEGSKYTIDLYITAPSVIKLFRFYGAVPAGANSYGFGYLTGYLINN